MATHRRIDTLAQFGQPACDQGLQFGAGIVPILRRALPKSRLRQQANAVPHQADFRSVETVTTAPVQERAGYAPLADTLRPVRLTQPLWAQHYEAVTQDRRENIRHGLGTAVKCVRQNYQLHGDRLSNATLASRSPPAIRCWSSAAAGSACICPTKSGRSSALMKGCAAAPA